MFQVHSTPLRVYLQFPYIKILVFLLLPLFTIMIYKYLQSDAVHHAYLRFLFVSW